MRMVRSLCRSSGSISQDQTRAATTEPPDRASGVLERSTETGSRVMQMLGSIERRTIIPSRVLASEANPLYAFQNQYSAAPIWETFRHPSPRNPTAAGVVASHPAKSAKAYPAALHHTALEIASLARSG